jgi:hypothetical protein
MNIKPLYHGLYLLLCLAAIVACQVETSSDVDETQISNPVTIAQQVGINVNLVSLVDLDQTVQIDVLQREDGDDSTSLYYEELFTITYDETIHSLVDALDKDLELSPRASCPALYTLVFHLADGRQYEFGYACEMASPSFLRGGQVFWQGLDVIAPDIFNHLLSVNLNEAGSLETPFQE